MNGIKKIAFLIVLAIILIGGSLYAEPRFYLSTDKIYTPGEESFVTLEARGLPYVDIRVYRIDDPKAFFLSQGQPHQPREINEYAGVNALEILRTVFDRDLTLLREFPRRFINYKFRAEILAEFENLKEALIPSEKHPIHSVIRLLGKYPMLRHFRQTLSQTGATVEEGSEGEDYYSGAWIYQKIPIFESTPGVYLVEGVNGNNVGYTMVVVSRLALITKQSGDSLLCYVVDKITGQPVSDSPIIVLNNTTRKKIAEGKTDKKGLFFTSVKNVSQLTIIGGGDKQFAIIDPSFFPVAVDHRKVYIYTDRPVYRPGQEVFYKGIVRDFLNENYKPAAPAPVNVVVYDPKGDKVTEDKATVNSMGTFNGRFDLLEESPLGIYKVIAEVDGKYYQAEFKIEEYKKPKFLVDVRLQGSGLNGAKVNAEVIGKYYFGPPVQDASLHYYIYRTRFYVPWWMDEDFSWYYSEAEYRSTRQELVTEGEGVLNKNGQFYFSFDTKPDSQDYTYVVEVRVKDSSEYTVTSASAIKTSTGQYNIGIRSQRLVYTANQDVSVTCYTRDLNNKPLPTGFDFKAIQIDTMGKDAKGKPQTKETVIFSKHLESDKDGKAWVTFKAQKCGHIMLVAKGLDKFNNVIQSTSSIWVAVQGQPVTYSGEGIEIIADKLSYRSGENARFLVLSRVPNIPFLFTVEGGNLYYYKVHQFSGNSCVIDIPLKAQYTPNVYVQATSIFKDQFFQRQKTVIIPPEEKLLNVTITTDKKIYGPGDSVKADILVRDYKKQPAQAEVSLGVVDEAIYAISPELVVEMQKFFYPRKRNNVRTNNSLIFNFYGYSQEIKPQLAALEMRPNSGLSSFKVIFERTLRSRFKDTCFWTPAVMTGANGVASVSFVLPDNITQWRFTARAVNGATQVGAGVEKVISRRDLTLQLDTPQTFTENDEVILPVLLKNNTAQPMQGAFQFEVQGARITTDFAKTFTLGAYGSAGILVKVKIITKGKVVIKAYAASGANKDGVMLTVPVTPYGVEKAQAMTGILAPTEKNKTFTFTLSDDGYNRFLMGRLYIHTGIYRALLTSLTYLASYPYGCVEQTMSGFLPDVVLAGILEKQKIDNPELKKNVTQYVNAGIAKLLGFQLQNGGWGWWNENEQDYSMTAYVMYGLTLARNLGYTMNDDAYKRGLKALETMVAGNVPDETRIACLYVLTLADRAPVSIIMDVYNKRETMSNYSHSILALTLAKAGKNKEAEALADILISKCTYNEGSQTASWQSNVKYRLISENAEIETTAFALQALVKIKPKDPRVYAAAKWLMSKRNGERWNSTRDTAAVTIALSELLADRGVREKTNESIRYRLNNKTWRNISPEKLYSDKGDGWMYLLYDELKKGENILEIEKNSDSELFLSMSLLYYSDEESTETRTGPLKVIRRYYRMSSTSGNGKYDVTQFSDINNITLKPGEEFLVSLEIKPTQSYDYMMLEDFIPAGFQIIDRTKGFDFIDEWIKNSLEKPVSTYKEVRDNRMVFFFNQLNPNQNLTVHYIMRAALEGDYQVNPAVIRSMYYEDRRALAPRFHVNVKAEKNRIGGAQ